MQFAKMPSTPGAWEKTTFWVTETIATNLHLTKWTLACSRANR
jgi:hypothetical protein